MRPEQGFRPEIEIPKTEADLPPRYNVEQFAETVNFRIINDIFHSLAVRSGVDPSSLQSLDKNKIDEVNWFGATGVRVNDKIGVNPLEKLDDDNRKLVHLWTIIHEFVHLSTKQGHQLSGYSQNRPSRLFGLNKLVLGETVFQQFDEGVTESLALLILQEYVRAANFMGGETALIQRFREKHPDVPLEEDVDLVDIMGTHATPYKTNIKIVQLLGEKIAQDAEVDEKIVWQSFIKGAFQHDNLLDPEMKEYFSKWGDPKLIEGIAEMSKKEKGKQRIVARLERMLRN